MRCVGWKTEFMSVVFEETRLARDCEREEAVDCSCACRLAMLVRLLLLLLSNFDCAPESGLESVFSRRNMPETAYETG